MEHIGTLQVSTGAPIDVDMKQDKMEQAKLHVESQTLTGADEKFKAQ